MRHRRIVVLPSVRSSGRATLTAALLIGLLALGWTAFRTGTFEWSVALVPLVVILGVGIGEAVWVSARAPRRITADETGLEIQERIGTTTRLDWNDLASRERAVPFGTLVLRRRNGSTVRISPLGVPREGWREIDVRVTDVAELRGPPVPAGGEEPASAEPPPPPSPGSYLAGLAGACGGALVGALLWGLIGGVFGVEIGWVAIGVGALVGSGASFLGGRGDSIGWACAVIALFAIFTGKGLGFRIVLEKELTKAGEEFDRELYDRIGENARDWAEGVPDRELAEFMVSHGYAEGTRPAEVTAEEIAGFHGEVAPFLKQWNLLPPRFEEWQEEARISQREAVYEHLGLFGGAIQTLGILDILFAVLGAGTAFRMGRGHVLPPVRRPRARRAGSAGSAGPAGTAAPADPADPTPASPPPPGTGPRAPRS